MDLLLHSSSRANCTLRMVGRVSVGRVYGIHVGCIARATLGWWNVRLHLERLCCTAAVASVSVACCSLGEPVK